MTGDLSLVDRLRDRLTARFFDLTRDRLRERDGFLLGTLLAERLGIGFQRDKQTEILAVCNASAPPGSQASASQLEPQSE